MTMQVKVALDPDGPIAVKTATGDDDVVRLLAEVERLEQARHPGVVSVVGHDLSAQRLELRTRFAGDPLSLWRGSVAGVAGLGAAVATTLADLHAVGVVHGRLDGTHILVGDDGRPRLCGLSHSGGATPADDVLALGLVLGELLARVPNERRGPRSWARRVGGDLRALELALARAVDPVATRRPTAQVLADSILAAVPRAELPVPTGAPIRLDDRRASVLSAPRLTPKDDRLPPRDTDHRLPPPDTDHRLRPPDTDHRLPPPDTDDGLPEPVDPSDEPDDELLQILFTHELTDEERWAQAFGSEPAERPTAAAEVGDQAASPPSRDPEAWVPAAVCTAADDITEEHSLAAGRAGRAPEPAPRAPARRPPTRRLVAAGAGALGVGVLAALGLVVIPRAIPHDAPARSAADHDPVAAAGCASVAEPAADVDGDGCADTLAIDGHTIAARGARWQLGEPGDLVAVGDWDCDGAASPAVLRPATGDVFVFTGWAAAHQPVTVEPSRTVAGGLGIWAQRTEGGCDRLLVDRASGGPAEVEVSRR